MTDTPDDLTKQAIAAGDALMGAAKKAIALLDSLAEQNETMKRAASGVLPDGTPVEDMLSELKELKVDNEVLRQALRTVKREVLGANSSTAYATIKKLRDAFK